MGKLDPTKPLTPAQQARVAERAHEALDKFCSEQRARILRLGIPGGVNMPPEEAEVIHRIQRLGPELRKRTDVVAIEIRKHQQVEEEGIAYTTGELRLVAQKQVQDPYHKDIIKWAADRIDKLEAAASAVYHGHIDNANPGAIEKLREVLEERTFN